MTSLVALQVIQQVLARPRSDLSELVARVLERCPGEYSSLLGSIARVADLKYKRRIPGVALGDVSEINSHYDDWWTNPFGLTDELY